MIRNLTMSFKPIWLMGVGSLFGLACLALFGCMLLLLHRRSADVFWDVVRQRVVWPVLMLAGVLGCFSLAMIASDATGGRFYDQKADAIASIARLPFVGAREWKVNVPAETTDQIVGLNIRARELKHLQLQSDQSLTIGLDISPAKAERGDRTLELLAGEPFEWTRGREPSGPLTEKLDVLYVLNESGTDATLAIESTTQPEVPQSRVIVWSAVGLIVFVMTYWLIGMLFPKIAAVAMTTGKEAVTQPLFFLTMAAGGVLLFFLLFLPYFTFGEDVKVYKDAGLQLIMVLAIFLALWTASVSVADEIEGRTALTVLSKPIGRAQFILGKYLGVIAPVALMFILLGTLFLIGISYKVVYDARESGNFYVIWQDCFDEVFRTVPGLLLAFQETLVLAAISVAISTRLSMMANLTVCTAIYVVGHLVPLFVQSSVGEFPIVQFMGQLFATILPVLEHFNVYAAVAAGQEVPLSYVGAVAVYSFIYITIAMLLALALFDDRDLA